MTPRPASIRPRRLALAAVLVAATALTSCGGGDGDDDEGASAGPELETVRVVLDWTPNTNHAGMYLADAEGWYEDAGIEVEFVEPGEAGALAVLAADRAEVAVSVQEDVLAARNEGLPVRSVAAIIESNTSSLVSLAADGIERPRDLEGTRYGGYGGPLEQALIDRLVTCDGGDPSKVEMVDVGEADYRVGLEQDQYDVVWIFDGWDGIRLAELEGVDVATLPFAEQTDCIPDWYTPLLATSEQVEAERSDDLEAFLAATSRGYQAAMADPAAAAAALLDAAPDLDPELVERSSEFLATRYAEDPEAWGAQTEQRWVDFAAFLAEAGLIDGDLAVDEAWTDEHLPAP
jgi:ABC-type nitrate/sulfonate/bicarbonate transport system substrate-binding protein